MKERASYNKKWAEENKDKINKRRRNNADTPNGKFTRYKQSARRNNRKFNLSKKDFIKIIKQKCYYCNEYEENKNFVGIDRIDSNLGYVLDNCTPCCLICNRMKMALSIEKFMGKIKKIHEAHYEKQKTQN